MRIATALPNRAVLKNQEFPENCQEVEGQIVPAVPDNFANVSPLPEGQTKSDSTDVCLVSCSIKNKTRR